MHERTSTRFETFAGSLLLAHPSLQEETFRRTVVLLANHDGDGAMGVVLNRPLGYPLGQLGTEFAVGPLADIPLFQGGPVETKQVILCAWRPQPDGEGFQLMFGLDPQKAAELADEDEVHLRAFLGYAGWTGGQLEGELARDTWVVTPLQPRLMEIEPDERLWKEVLGGIDPSWRLMAGEPDDPELN